MTPLLRRLLLLLYPRAFRRRHGAELLDAMAEQAADVRYAGRGGRFRYWREIADDAVRAAWRLRVVSPGPARRLDIARVRTASVHRFPSAPGAVQGLVNDLRHATRALVRRPGFTAAAVMMLALGIGGTSLIAGLVDGLVLRPFHYPDPDRLVTIGVTFPRASGRESFIEVLSPPEYLDISAARSLEDVLGFDLGNRNLSGGDVPERVFTALVFGDPFATLRMPRCSAGASQTTSSRRAPLGSRSSAIASGRAASAQIRRSSAAPSA